MSNTNTALSLSSATSAASHAVRAYNPQNDIIKQLAISWNAASGDQKASWIALARQISSPTSSTGRSKNSGYRTFVQFNSTQIHMGNQPLLTAPLPTPAALMPAISLGVAFVGPTLVLTLTPAGSYENNVLIYAAAPVPAGTTLTTKTPYLLLGSLSSLGGPTNITSLVTDRYRFPGSGYQLTLKLVGVSTGGFRTAPQVITTVINGFTGGLTLE